MPKKKRNILILLISIIGVLIIVGIFSYSYFENKEEIQLGEDGGVQGEAIKEAKEDEEEKRIEESVKEETVEVKSDKKTDQSKKKTRDWQSYENTLYDYNLKYPKDWHQSPENKEDSWIAYFLNQEVEDINEIDLNDGVKVEILVQGNPRNLSLEEWAREGHIFIGEPKSSNKIQVAGFDAIKEESDANGMSLTIYFFNDNDVYTISYSGTESDYNKYKEEFDLMIGSFEFVEQDQE